MSAVCGRLKALASIAALAGTLGAAHSALADGTG
jgi:hypothetical protein